MTTRRNFLKGMLGLGGVIVAAPAICKAENLMKIWVPSQKIDILNFGNLVWRPELVQVMPIEHDTDELIVQPQFQHAGGLTQIEFIVPYGSEYRMRKLRQDFMTGLSDVQQKMLG